MVTMKKTLHFCCILYILTAGNQSLSRTDYSPPGRRFLSERSALPVVSHFFSRPSTRLPRLPGHCRRLTGLFQPALFLFSPAGPS
jgi:hypothetical protein